MSALIVDTSALLAFFDASEPDHAAVSAALTAEAGALVVSPFVVAELDYLVAARIGVDAELAVLDELAQGAWDLPEFGAAELAEARAVVQRYRDQDIGVADASNVVLAGRYGTDRIATLDHRHFSVLHTDRGGAFTLVPGDAGR
ncbi:PIN domain-containing protein [Tomitella gaofuii]|uniref:PIN domain-containing protein n=1 Tax=Tomitella gaofuii TaxID=2760083 RepID=UPI0023EE3C47|nr:PIN domain-containing protein [Tomitella gaofuii]